jgi:beta-lactamase class A
MSRLQSLDALSASLPRRGLLIGAASLAAVACQRTPMMTASRTPTLDMDRLNREVAALADRARPGVLGVGLLNLESGQNFTYRGDRRFPMQSVFKLPLAAAALNEVDNRRLSLTETVTLAAKTLSPPWSPIADAWPGRAVYTVAELLQAAVGDSDNTAADLLMKRIGGPGAVSSWLQQQRVAGISVDRYERQLQPDILGMASFRAAWKGEAAFAAARDTVSPARRHAAALDYLADPRDTATPLGMLDFLAKLDANELISERSTHRLLAILAQTPRGAERLKAGLPRDAAFAHKTGTSETGQGLSLAYNDVGIFTLRNHRRYGAVAFLSGSTAPVEARATLFADLGRVMATSLG